MKGGISDILLLGDFYSFKGLEQQVNNQLHTLLPNLRSVQHGDSNAAQILQDFEAKGLIEIQSSNQSEIDNYFLGIDKVGKTFVLNVANAIAKQGISTYRTYCAFHIEDHFKKIKDDKFSQLYKFRSIKALQDKYLSNPEAYLSNPETATKKEREEYEFHLALHLKYSDGQVTQPDKINNSLRNKNAYVRRKVVRILNTLKSMIISVANNDKIENFVEVFQLGEGHEELLNNLIRLIYLDATVFVSSASDELMESTAAVEETTSVGEATTPEPAIVSQLSQQGWGGGSSDSLFTPMDVVGRPLQDDSKEDCCVHRVPQETRPLGDDMAAEMLCTSVAMSAERELVDSADVALSSTTTTVVASNEVSVVDQRHCRTTGARKASAGAAEVSAGEGIRRSMRIQTAGVNPTEVASVQIPFKHVTKLKSRVRKPRVQSTTTVNDSDFDEVVAEVVIGKYCSDTKTEFNFLDDVGLVSRDRFQSCQEYNRLAIDRSAKEKFLNISMYNFRKDKFVLNDVIKQFQLMIFNHQNELTPIINQARSTKANGTLIEFDDRRKTVNVDLDESNLIYQYILAIVELFTELKLVDPDSVAVNAFGRKGVIVMVKDLNLEPQLPHCDYRNPEDGYISYLSTTLSEHAAEAYRPDLGDGGCSLFINPFADPDYLGLPGGRQDYIDEYSFALMNGDHPHFGTGNQRAPNGIWKVFVHLDPPGYDRAANIGKRNAVWLREVKHTVVREREYPYRVVASEPINKYCCQYGCSVETEDHLKVFSYHLYPHCSTCFQHKFNIKLSYKLNKEDKVADLFKDAEEIQIPSARSSATYVGTKTLKSGSILGPVVKGDFVSLQNYEKRHPQYRGQVIDAIRLQVFTNSRNPEPDAWYLDESLLNMADPKTFDRCAKMYLDFSNYRSFLLHFEKDHNEARCNLLVDFDVKRGVGELFIRKDIRRGDRLVVYSSDERSLSKDLFVEFNEDCAEEINTKVVNVCFYACREVIYLTMHDSQTKEPISMGRLQVTNQANFLDTQRIPNIVRPGRYDHEKIGNVGRSVMNTFFRPVESKRYIGFSPHLRFEEYTSAPEIAAIERMIDDGEDPFAFMRNKEQASSSKEKKRSK